MGLREPSGSGAREGRPAEVAAQVTRFARTEGARMSGAGRGVPPGAEPDAGQGESAASPEAEQAESKAEASGQADDGDAAAQAQTAAAPTDGKAAGGGKPAAPRARRKRSFWRE